MAHVKERRSLTSVGLLDATGWTPAKLGALLVSLESKRRVYLACDTTHDQRMGGLKLADGRSVTLVSLRDAS